MQKISHIRHFRNRPARYNIRLHPECDFEIAQAAHFCGSTSFIIRTVSEAEPGSHWAIGTEINLVERLARQYPDRVIEPLTRFGTRCGSMNRIDPAHLLWVLEAIQKDEPVNVIRVDPAMADDARTALDRMLKIS